MLLAVPGGRTVQWIHVAHDRGASDLTVDLLTYQPKSTHAPAGHEQEPPAGAERDPRLQGKPLQF